MTSTVTPYRSRVDGARAGFARLARAEWTKFVTVPRWMITVGAAVLLSVLVSGLVSTGMGENTSDDGGGGPPPVSADPLEPFQDRGHFVGLPRSGDVDLIARVDSQTGGGDWAKAGLMIRGATEPGSLYAAIAVTPGNGVVLRSGTDVDIAGSGAGAPTWLRLTRSGDKITALESADGVSWTGVGTVELDGLGDDVLAGLFVAAPDEVVVTRQFGTESISGNTAYTTAAFDDVTVSGTGTSDWIEREHPSGPAAQDDTTGYTVSGGVYTVTGSGDLGPDMFSPDSTRMVLNTTLIGLCAMIALAVLFITAEYRRGMIRTTFMVSPSRTRVLLAKTAVIGTVGFATGLVSALGSFLAAKAGTDGLALPDLFAWPVVRAIVGSGVLLAAAAILALALGSLIRRSAIAIAVALLALLVPQMVASGLPLAAANWLERLSPAAGFAIQQTVPRYDTAIGPEAGIAVLCAYAAVATGFALWSLKRRDA